MMAFVTGLMLKIRRGQTPPFSYLKQAIRFFLHSHLPLPGFLRPLLRGMYEAHFLGKFFLMRAFCFFYAEPLFRARCNKVGKRFSMIIMPHIIGHTQVEIGDHVSFSGKVGIMSGGVCENPRLILRDHVHISHMVSFTVNKEVIVDEGAMIASGCTIADSDGHPREYERRIKGLPPTADECLPVYIGKHAWIGADCIVLKGVSIGEGAVIGANSVVVRDVPPFAMAAGSPAKVIIPDVREKRESGTTAQAV